jgi:hypothetical protein
MLGRDCKKGKKNMFKRCTQRPFIEREVEYQEAREQEQHAMVEGDYI